MYAPAYPMPLSQIVMWLGNTLPPPPPLHPTHPNVSTCFSIHLLRPLMYVWRVFLNLVDVDFSQHWMTFGNRNMWCNHLSDPPNWKAREELNAKYGSAVCCFFLQTGFNDFVVILSITLFALACLDYMTGNVFYLFLVYFLGLCLWFHCAGETQSRREVNQFVTEIHPRSDVFREAHTPGKCSNVDVLFVFQASHSQRVGLWTK